MAASERSAGGIFVFLAISLAGAGFSGAQPRPRLRLEWTAPAGCSSAAEIEAAVARLLGTAPPPSDSPPLDVVATARPGPGGLWQGEVEMRSGAKVGRRNIQAESCQAVADATALIAALTIDPDAVTAQQAPPSAETSSVPPAPPTASALASAPPPPRLLKATTPPAVSRQRLSVWAEPLVIADVGALPKPTIGAGVAGGINWNRSTLEVGAAQFAEGTATIAGTVPAAGGDFRLRAFWLAACPALQAGHFDLGVCGQVELAAMKGTGFGVSSGYENSYLWPAVGGGVLARLHLSQAFSVPLRLGLSFPLRYPTFTLKGIGENQGRVHRPALGSGRLSLGVAVTF
ncbi:MAG TPA: hypothetical protein VEX18_14265 [Polyangiaceae bacterium]|nr:hypothetical protein [Polyangiaceae bacterium]